MCHFAIISTRSASSETANYPGTKLVGVAFKLRKKIKDSPSFVDVLPKTLNLVISRCCFAEDGKEMYQNLKRTCRAIVFVLRRCRCRRRRRRRRLSSLVVGLMSKPYRCTYAREISSDTAQLENNTFITIIVEEINTIVYSFVLSCIGGQMLKNDVYLYMNLS